MPEPANTTELAWAGWRMRIPPDVRPVSVTGDRRRGAMMLGDAAQALLQVKWWRPARARFDAERWIRRRVRRLAGRRAACEPAEAGGFAPAAAATDHRGRGGGPRKLWYGYHAQADLAVELVINLQVPPRQARRIDRLVLPSLSADRDGRQQRWAVFDVAFVVPAEFRYRASRLLVGDMALCFTAAGGRRLLVRQVYPSDLALSRRDLARWLASGPFKEHRRLRPAGEPESFRAASFGRTLEGVLRCGRKALPAPLGMLAPRWSVAAAVEDTDLGRLLIAEYDDPSPASADPVAEAVANMNYTRFPTGC